MRRNSDREIDEAMPPPPPSLAQPSGDGDTSALIMPFGLNVVHAIADRRRTARDGETRRTAGGKLRRVTSGRILGWMPNFRTAKADKRLDAISRQPQGAEARGQARR